MQENKISIDLGFETILFATDLTSSSDRAERYAVLLAEELSKKLVVAHAFFLSQAAMEVESEALHSSRQRADLAARLRSSVSLLDAPSIQVEEVLLEGDPREVIPSLAQKHKPVLLVVGTQGRGTLARGVIGSVAEAILRSSTCPVLTVGPKVDLSRCERISFRRILFASDLSTAAAHASAYAVNFARRFGAELDVLNVVKSEDAASAERMSALFSSFKEALVQAMPQDLKELVNAKTLIEVGSVPKKILEHIEEKSIDLLVLGIKKSSHIDIAMRTSRAFQIIVNASCPVLTVMG
jgi:nucleotide-binding universal stress UspA family protein